MTAIIASDVPYVAGFIIVAALGFWLLGRAADRGWLAGPGDKVLPWLAASCFGVTAVWRAIDHEWLHAAASAVGALLFFAGGLRRKPSR